MLKGMDDGVKIIIVVIVFGLMIAFIFLMPNKTVDSESINSYLNKIDNNYTLVVNDNITYSRDKDVEVFENAENKYFKYNGKIYLLESETASEVESIPLLDDKYSYDINLIKKVNEYCKYEVVVTGVASCKISAENYNKELTNMYGIGRLDTSDIVLTYYYNDKSINRIDVDFSDNKYNIVIKNTNNNNFSELLTLINQ